LGIDRASLSGRRTVGWKAVRVRIAGAAANPAARERRTCFLRLRIRDRELDRFFGL